MSEKSIHWSKAIIGNAHMTRSLWLVALESKAGRHVYNGESMHLSVLLRSKIWCSLRILIAPSLMALLPLKVDAVSLCWTSLRDSRENDREGWTCHDRRGEFTRDGMTTSVCNWSKWLDFHDYVGLPINVCTMKLYLLDNHQRLIKAVIKILLQWI